MVGSRGCSLTTSRLQRLVRSILSAMGPRASANGHRSDQRDRASHHRDRREARSVRQGC
jgi:hypothetical protein